MCSAFLSLGVSQVENQILLVLFGFKQHEFALVFAISGAGMFLAQVIPSARCIRTLCLSPRNRSSHCSALHLGPHQTAILTVCLGPLQVILMPLLLLVVRERALIVTGYAALVVKFLGLAVAQTPAQVLLATAIGSLTVMAYPSISSIKANAVPEHEQGAVQGALSGATALATGIGPLVFNQLYSWVTTVVFLPRVCLLLSTASHVAATCRGPLCQMPSWPKICSWTEQTECPSRGCTL